MISAGGLRVPDRTMVTAFSHTELHLWLLFENTFPERLHLSLCDHNPMRVLDSLLA